MTKLRKYLRKTTPKFWTGIGFSLFEVLVVYYLGHLTGWWWLAAFIVAVCELRVLRPMSGAKSSKRLRVFWERLPGLIMGLSITLIIALVPREVTQIVASAMYGLWLIWREREPKEVSTSLVQVLIVQGVMFEAIFLMAAIWQVPSLIILALVWAGSYTGVYGVLSRRGDRSAGVMAATWAVIATEVSWILLTWLITYTMRGGYILVPQPALILTALTYVFGSILASSRQGNLSRARLAEYMAIGVVLVAIVVLGTSWRGNV